MPSSRECGYWRRSSRRPRAQAAPAVEDPRRRRQRHVAGQTQQRAAGCREERRVAPRPQRVDAPATARENRARPRTASCRRGLMLRTRAGSRRRGTASATDRRPARASAAPTRGGERESERHRRVERAQREPRAPARGPRQQRGQGPGHQYSRSLTRRRAIDWLCSWQTRDSVTLSTAAISFRFMSCS